MKTDCWKALEHMCQIPLRMEKDRVCPQGYVHHTVDKKIWQQSICDIGKLLQAGCHQAMAETAG